MHTLVADLLYRPQSDLPAAVQAILPDLRSDLERVRLTLLAFRTGQAHDTLRKVHSRRITGAIELFTTQLTASNLLLRVLARRGKQCL